MGMEDARPWILCRFRSDADIRSHSEQSLYILRDFRTDPESDQADRASLGLEHFSLPCHFVPANDWPGSKVCLEFPSGRNMTVVVLFLYLAKPGEMRRQL